MPLIGSRDFDNIKKLNDELTKQGYANIGGMDENVLIEGFNIIFME